eukprot:jgi/Botrbrau1/22761/Bobra.0132s0092.1
MSRVFERLVVGLAVLSSLSFGVLMNSDAPTSKYDPVGGLFDPATYALWVVDQLLTAQVTDIFPTSPARLYRPTPRTDLYKLEPCARVNISSCLYRGNSSNGLPESLQGIFWMDGIGLEDEAVGMAGVWDPVKRSLAICPGCTRNWAYKGTSSQQVPPFNWWSPSGAALYNLALWSGGIYELFLNKELTYGEVLPRFKVLNQTIYVPSFLLNFSMVLQPDGSWYRESKLLFNLIDSPTGRYTFRRIIDGQGRHGPFFQEWLAARNGSPTMIPLQVSS